MNIKLYVLFAVLSVCSVYGASQSGIDVMKKNVVQRLDSLRKSVARELNPAVLEQLQGEFLDLENSDDVRRARVFDPRVDRLFKEVGQDISRRLDRYAVS